MNKLRITPIGTCRIHSPLRRAAARYPIEIDVRRNYGFVHTSDEALQQLRFLTGEKTFDPAVAPLVLRNGKDEFQDQSWEPTDLHIVEISSSKSLKCGEDSVQSNYLHRFFADFFASNQRTRTYWNLVKKGHRGKLGEFLREQASFQMLHSAERELLLNLRIEQQSFKDVKSDMEEIVARLGVDRVLFVTHVNALTPEEERIPNRDRLIRWVKLAAEQIGAAVFDPTESMLEFGQERAMEKGGLDLTHYTPAFFDKLYEDLHISHVGARIEAAFGAFEHGEPGEDNVEILAANFDTMLDIGDFFATAKHVYAALDKAPDAVPLIALRGLIRTRIGDYAGAAEDFSRTEQDSGLSLQVRTAMIEAHAQMGDHQEALQVAEALIEDEFASAEIYRAAAQAAASAGKMDTAIRHAKQAFRSDRTDLSAALEALRLISDAGSPEHVAEWRSEILENASESSAGAFEICMWAIEHHDERLFTAGLKAIDPREKGSTLDLLEDASNAGMDLAVADCIPQLVGIGRVSRTMAERRTAILDRLLARAGELFEERRLDDAFFIADKLVQLADVESSQVQTRKLAAHARNLVRSIVRDMRVRIRDAYARKDDAAILEEKEAAGDILIDEPDVAVIVARTLYTSGKKKQALALFKRIHAKHPDNVPAMRWTGRLAGLAKDYTTAIAAYGRLRALPEDERKQFDAEIEAFFSTAGRRLLRPLRELVENEDIDGMMALIEQVRRHELEPRARVEGEIRRVYRTLRLRLKEIDQGELDIEEREPVLRHLRQIEPDDQGTLRRLALELMRQFRFAEAAEVWAELLAKDPENESAERNLDRCRRLAIRRSSAQGVGEEAAA